MHLRNKRYQESLWVIIMAFFSIVVGCWSAQNLVYL